jgi:hypothetical protein
MTDLRTIRLLVVACSVLIGMQAWGHHSRLAFDLDNSIDVEGTVTEIGWTNPHFYLSLVETTPDGEVTWTFEGHSIPGLIRNGWTKTSLRVGERVRVGANPNRSEGVYFALLDHVTRTDGKTFYSFRRPNDPDHVPPPLAPAEDMAGTWVLIRSLRANLVSVVAPPDDWPLKPAAQEEVSRFDVKNDPALRCEPLGLPRMLVWPYAQHWQRVEDGYEVTIEHSEEHRRIYATGNTPEQPASPSGTSTGSEHSDGSYLVTTRNFAPQPWGNARGISSSDEKQVSERYTLEDDGYRLHIEYTVADPVYLEEPVTMSADYRKVHDFTFGEEPACDTATATRHLDFET